MLLNFSGIREVTISRRNGGASTDDLMLLAIVIER